MEGGAGGEDVFGVSKDHRGGLGSLRAVSVRAAGDRLGALCFGIGGIAVYVRGRVRDSAEGE